MSEKTELSQLKKELAALQKQVAKLQERSDDLRQFLQLQKPKGEAAYLHIRCWGITLSHPDQPGKSQAMLMSTEDGPYLSLWGSDEKARLTVQVEKDEATVRLLTKELKTAVELAVDEPDGRGQVAVFDKGSPRALMKAAATGIGAVSVVHDDGQVRAGMISTEHKGGEIHTVTPDMKMGVKITSDAPNGGAVVVNFANGKPGVALICSDEFGAVMVNRRNGKIMATLPDPDRE